MNVSVKYWLREICIVALAAVAIFFVLQFTLMKAEVVGQSMEPNLLMGDQIMINKMAYSFGTPQRGDVVVFSPPHITGATQNYIKRVIGLPGEIVSIKGGEVQITTSDGSTFILDEPFITNLAMFDYESNTIPVDSYFVLGDNRGNSSDSRGGWTVPVQNIIGKAWFSLSPCRDGEACCSCLYRR